MAKTPETIAQRLTRLSKGSSQLSDRCKVLLRVYRMRVIPQTCELDVYQQRVRFLIWHAKMEGVFWDIHASLADGKRSVVCGDINGSIRIKLSDRDAAAQIKTWIRRQHTENAATKLAEKTKLENARRERKLWEKWQQLKEHARPADMLVPWPTFKKDELQKVGRA